MAQWQFEVDMDVVCITDGWVLFAGTPMAFRPPHKGEVFRIIEIEKIGSLARDFAERTGKPVDVIGDPETPFLRFAERHPLDWFTSNNFRPVRKTDIGDLRKLTAPKPKKVVKVLEGQHGKYEQVR
jgi:hypothetical protein